MGGVEEVGGESLGRTRGGILMDVEGGVIVYYLGWNGWSIVDKFQVRDELKICLPLFLRPCASFFRSALLCQPMDSELLGSLEHLSMSIFRIGLRFTDTIFAPPSPPTLPSSLSDVSC